MTTSLLGCGNKGDLYLPDDAAQEKSKEVKPSQVESNNKDMKQDED